MKFLNEIDGANKVKEDSEHQFVTESERIRLSELSNVPFVEGTQTTTTSSWTGVAPTVESLYDGLTIMYWLPRTSTSTNVTLNLTLKGGSTTGAIPCYYGGTSRLTTHYPAGSVIVLTYIADGLVNGVAYTGWYAHAQYNTTYSVITEAEITTGTSTTGRVISAQRLTFLSDKVKSEVITVGTEQPTVGWWFKEI